MIGGYAFNNTALTSILLPAATYSLGSATFRGSPLKEITCLAVTPPLALEYSSTEHHMEIYEEFGSFDGVDKDSCVIHVFENALTDYQAATGWREFSHYETIDETMYVPGDINGDGVVDIADVNGVINQFLGKGAKIITVNNEMLAITPVEGGTFMMGVDVEVYDGFPTTPVHQVTLDDYMISIIVFTTRCVPICFD